MWIQIAGKKKFSTTCWCLTCRLLMPLLCALTISLWLASSMWRVRLARTCVASELGRVAPTSRPRNSRSITAAATSSILPRSRLNPEYSTYAIPANLCCAHRSWSMSLRVDEEETGGREDVVEWRVYCRQKWSLTNRSSRSTWGLWERTRHNVSSVHNVSSM